MILNNEQIEFVKKHKIPLRYILDAEWMSTQNYKYSLNNSWYIVAVNTTICNKWHKLSFRDRHWRCVECRVWSFSFIKPSEIWYVYLVWSKKWEIFKIWYTLKLEDRLHHLKKDSYWWYNDWEIIYYAKYKWALEIENKIHNSLNQYWVDKEYNHYWKTIKCYELFDCEISKIIDTINKINENIWNEDISEKYIKNDYKSIFSFNKKKDIINLIIDEKTNIEDNYDLYFRKYWIINKKNIH